MDSLAVENRPKALVGQFGIGNRDCAQQVPQLHLLPGIGRLRELCLDRLVDQGVDAADEERGDRDDLVDRLADHRAGEQWLPRLRVESGYLCDDQRFGAALCLVA